MQPETRKKQKNKNRFFLFGISTEEKNFFIENVSLLLDSDMGVSYALETLGSEAKTPAMRQAIGNMRDSLLSGSSFWKALDAPKIFPARLISLVKIGEEGGTLAESLKSGSREAEKEKKFHGKLRSALIYPGMVFLVAIVVVLVASWTVLPKLTAIFKESNVALPLATRILVGFGDLMVARGIYIVPGVILVLGALYYFLFLFKKTKFTGDFLLFHTPGFKTILQTTEIARMGYSCGTLLKAGVSVTTVFESLAEGASLTMYQKLYMYIRDRIRQGDTIQKAINSYPHSRSLIPFQVTNLIGVAEKSGKLSETFTRIGGLYEDKSDTFTKNIGTIIEPLIVIVVGLVVAGVVFAIITPIYSLTTAIA